MSRFKSWVTTVEDPYRYQLWTMVASQVTFIQSYTYNLYPVWGVRWCTYSQATTMGSTHLRTGYTYPNTGPSRDGINRVGKAPYRYINTVTVIGISLPVMVVYYKLQTVKTPHYLSTVSSVIRVRILGTVGT